MKQSSPFYVTKSQSERNTKLITMNIYNKTLAGSFKDPLNEQ